MRLMGDVALVSGAGKGIGKAIAWALAECGVAVAVNALHEASARDACRELMEAGHRACAVPADVSDEAAVVEMVKRATGELGPIDILANNAAAPAEFVLFADATAEVQRGELVTLIGVFNCTRHVVRSMIERERGRIINISSLAARCRQPGRAIYCAANAGIEAFTRTLAAEVGQYGITVNTVSPGATESPRFRARSEEIRKAHRAMIPLDRFAEPEEIAQAVLFLASDQANYITGAAIDVDGGFSNFMPCKKNLPQP